MNAKEMALASLDELREIAENIDNDQLEALKVQLLQAQRIFVAAAGRSLLAMKFFAMRLMQLGFTSYLVGEVCTPSIQAGDLLVLGSGSGETAGMKAIALKAKSLGVQIALLTRNPASSIAQIADNVVCINSPTGIGEGAAEACGQDICNYRSIRPSGNPFEQSIVIVTDALICSLMVQLNRGTAYIARNHANLE